MLRIPQDVDLTSSVAAGNPPLHVVIGGDTNYFVHCVASRLNHSPILHLDLNN
jgi:hypothetical protein